MQPSILFLATLLARATASSTLQKRWLDGDSATGTTDPAVTDDCEYWANDISSTDTCAELESFFDVTITELHAWNPSLLTDWCALIEGWSYCVEGPAVTDFVSSTSLVTTATATGTATTTSSATAAYSNGVPSPTQSGLISTCDEYYYVEKGDTCYNIQNSYMDFTLDEFYTWNPSISSGCSGLQPDYYVCVGVAGSTTTATATTTASSSSASDEPQQTGLVANCDNYYYVEKGDSCSAILTEFDITMADFYAWNPAVGSNCNTMQYGYYVCVGIPGIIASTTTTPSKTATSTASTTTSSSTVPSPTQSGITADCVTYYQAQTNDSCWSIVNEKYTYLNETEFIDWNPAVGSDCADLLADYYYCVATTSVEPMPDIISTCTTYYYVNEGDSCYSIEQAYSISEADFVKWNPDVGEGCASLWEGYFVCVGV
ncbi:LysM domain protein [Aspergillus ellipticus CBS 707.79]|uniref:LysM domain protein n=1 Tax=Aspergillus ellipticus CBS 707.79 TaxID=1448320 RepID=A0A319DUT8_9EURO|nr:LysM domain protein [Aspergillus ellipticus CBS 707.79]